MPDIEVTHSESWSMAIKPGDGETWPDCPVPYSRRANQLMRPDQINVHIHRNGSKPGVSLWGTRLKQDGTPGQQRVRHGLHGQLDGYGWIYEVVEKARRFADLGPGRTGVDW